MDDEQFLASLREFVGQSAGEPRVARDEVNQAMIRQFAEAMGDHNPVYVDEAAAIGSGRPGVVAPPPMLSTWLMLGYRAHTAARGGDLPDNALNRLLARLADAGFTGVVATDDEQIYERELRPGDRLTMDIVISEVSERKQTGLGAGHFVTTARTYRDHNGEVVGRQNFRILRFDPRTAVARAVTEQPGAQPEAADRADLADRPRPFITRDNAFWFEAANQSRLVIQRCTACGTLRHPPSPTCMHCLSFDWDTVTASGAATVHSFVVSHHPKAPGFDYPLGVVLADLPEGTRLVADYEGDPGELEIGMPLEITFARYDQDTVLPRFRRATSDQSTTVTNESGI